MASLRDALGGSIAEMLAGGMNGSAHSDAGDSGWTEGYATIEELLFEDRLQMRVEKWDDAYIEELREAIRAEEDLGRIQIHIVDGRWYVTDGWQRSRAHQLENYTQVPARWRSATFDEAFEAALQANTKHGKRLNDGDRWRKLEVAAARWRGELEGTYSEEVDALVGEMSQTDFARRTGLTVTFVHRNLPKFATLPEHVWVTRNGRRFVQSTSNIGRARKDTAEPATSDISATAPAHTAQAGTNSASAPRSAGSGSNARQGGTRERGGRSESEYVTVHIPVDMLGEFKEYLRDWEGAEELRNLILSQL